MKSFKNLFQSIVLLFFSFSLLAQENGSLDLSFNSLNSEFPALTGVYNGDVWTTSVMSNGKIFIGGTFETYNENESTRIARLNSNGSFDASFDIGSGPNEAVFTSAAHVSDKVLIGGNFTNYNQIESNYLARINSDGSYDQSFDIGSGANAPIKFILVQPDNKIIIAGLFTTYNNVPCNHIARLNTDGSIDLSFNIGTGANDLVETLAIQSDGKIIIGGAFTTFNNVMRTRIARLNSDGSIDETFNAGTSSSSTILSIAIQNSGKILVTGNFTSFNSVTSRRIVRLNDDGSIDTTFNIGFGANNMIRDVISLPNDDIVICGDFTSFNNTQLGKIAKIKNNGSVDLGFTASITTDFIADIALQPDNYILVAGRFESLNGKVSKNISRVTSEGVPDLTFNPSTGANNPITNILLLENENYLITGFFNVYNGVVCNYIAKINEDGNLFSEFNTGTGANASILGAALQEDGKIIVVGHFTQFNGVSCKHIARLNFDGSLDLEFNDGGIGAQSVITDVVVQPDGKILIIGSINSYNGITVRGVARLNTDGNLDTTFNTGTGAFGVNSIALQPDGKIVLAGDFTTFNDEFKKRIVRLNSDGSFDTTFNPGINDGASDVIYDVSLQTDGKIIISGYFSTYNNTVIYRLARLNSNGSLDTSFTPAGITEYTSLTSKFENGKVLIFGSTLEIGGEPIKFIKLLNDDGSLFDEIDVTFNESGQANCIKFQNNNKIIIGGDFKSVNNVRRDRIARINYSETLSDLEFIKKNEIIAYPNPTDGELFLKLDEMVSKVEIYNMLGVKVSEHTFNSDKVILNLHNLYNGPYIAKVFGNFNSYNVKFVKE